MKSDIQIVHIFKSSQYASCKDAGELYGLSASYVLRLAKEAVSLPRYEKAWVISNEGGSTLINLLVLEDFLYYRSKIKAGLSKHLPPYDPAEVRRQRGEVMIRDFVS